MTAKGTQLATLNLPPVGFRRTLRLALLGLLAVGAAAAWRWRGVLDPTTITAALDRYPAAPLWFLAAHTAASLLFVPRTLLAIVAGLLFGMGWGIVWAVSGSVAGAMAGFFWRDTSIRARSTSDVSGLSSGRSSAAAGAP